MVGMYDPPVSDIPDDRDFDLCCRCDLTSPALAGAEIRPEADDANRWR